MPFREARGEVEAFKALTTSRTLARLEQEVHTYTSSSHTANLDRAYTNLHVGWQQDRELFCDPLPRSALGRPTGDRHYHLPVRFGVVTPKERSDFRLPVWVTKRPEWGAVVEEQFRVFDPGGRGFLRAPCLPQEGLWLGCQEDRGERQGWQG